MVECQVKSQNIELFICISRDATIHKHANSAPLDESSANQSKTFFSQSADITRFQ